MSVVVVAVVFGLATLVAGGRVLAGADPGYVVFRPLVVYNTVMGLAYVGAGILTVGSVRRGRMAAAVILVLNIVVLGSIGYLYAAGSAVAVESLGAMTLRTVVWIVLFLALTWMERTGGVK